MSIDSTHWILTLVCRDQPGIVHAVSGAIVTAAGNITESQQFSSDDTGTFFMRLQVKSSIDVAGFEAALAPVIARYDMTWQLDVVGRPLRTLVLVSRAGHCLNDLLYRQHSGQLGIDIVAVVSNHPDLRPLTQTHGIDYHHLPVTDETRGAQETEILTLVEHYQADFVVLARYMQVLTDGLCGKLQGRAINIHHSFLPGFKGSRPYHQAHARGVKLIGATAHYVTGDLDEGPIIEQEIARVDHSQGPAALMAVGRDTECLALARAVRWHAEHRVLLNGAKTVVFR